MWSLFREHMKICELRNIFMHTFLCWFKCLSASRRRSYFYIHIAFQTVTHRLCRLRRRFMHKTAKNNHFKINRPQKSRKVFVAFAVTKRVKFRSNALLAVFLFPFLHFLSVLFSIEGGTQEDQEEEEEKKAALSPFGRAQSQRTQTYSIWMGHIFALGVHITCS